ncbi:MAG: lipopolysaccharide heptosyltransferase II [Candidatus Omnitrophica bacterium]|nr:lipopolysaccharide heptosyltransferase II [Candidatus Omnitrophota bacterium]
MIKSSGSGKRILIVNVNWIGDVIFSTPFIKAIRDAYPDGYIACLLHPRCADILKGSPRIDEIIIYDEEGRHKGIIGKLTLILYLRKRSFDMAFILHRSFTKALLTYLSGIKERIGYPTKSRGFLLTRTIGLPEEEVHKVEYFLGLARGYGIKVSENSYEFFVQDADRESMKKFLKSRGVTDKDRLIVLCPGGNWAPKRWPKKNFARLADMLAEGLSAKIVLSGAKKDSVLVEEIRLVMKSIPVISCGETTLKELGALLERADLVVANDSGPMHLAVAMKSNVIALFGPTSPGLTGPYGKGNYRVIWKTEGCDPSTGSGSHPEALEGCEVPCYDVTCADNRCMALITVEDVFREAEGLLRL